MKDAWRRSLIAARRAATDADRHADASALGDGLAAVVADLTDPLCLYVPVGSEPGLAPDGTRPLLDAALRLGRRVLVPVVVGAAPLDWAPYRGPDDLADADHGLQEPTAARLGPDAVRDAGLVLVPALAVDRRGMRLGRGAGHYDRTLSRLEGSTRVVAVVRDVELVDELPAEDHDVRMHAVWRPGHGVTALPSASPRG